MSRILASALFAATATLLAAAAVLVVAGQQSGFDVDETVQPTHVSLWLRD